MNAAAWFAVGALLGLILGVLVAYQVGRDLGYEQHQREAREIREMERQERSVGWETDRDGRLLLHLTSGDVAEAGEAAPLADEQLRPWPDEALL